MGWGLNNIGTSFGDKSFDPNFDPSTTTADDDALFNKNWEQIAQAAEQAGITKEAAWAAYNKAGRPRGKDAEHFQQALLSPQAQADRDTAPVAADPAALDLVRQVAGLPAPGEGTGRAQVATLGKPDPVQAAIAKLQGVSGQQQQDALAALQTAGDPSAAGQADLIKQLQLAASGQGPSAALALFQLALGKSINAQQGAAAGIRGGNAAAAARNAASLGSAMQMEGAGTAAAIRAQEQQAAQGLLGTTLAQTRAADIQRAGAVADVAGQIRGQDVAQAGMVAQLTAAEAALEEQKRQAQTGTALALLQTDLGIQGSNNALELAKIGMGTDWLNANANRDVQYAQLKQQREQANRAFWTNMIGSLLGAGGAALPFLLGGGGAGAAAAAGSVPGNPGIRTVLNEAQGGGRTDPNGVFRA